MLGFGSAAVFLSSIFIMSFIENLKELISDSKEYLRLELEELQIVGLLRFTKILSRLLVFTISVVLLGMLVLYVNIWIGLYLSELWGSFVKGFGAGIGVFAIEIILLVVILQPLLRKIISKVILAEIKSNKQVTDGNSKK